MDNKMILAILIWWASACALFAYAIGAWWLGLLAFILAFDLKSTKVRVQKFPLNYEPTTHELD